MCCLLLLICHLQVWASKWNERAYFSTRKVKLDHDYLCMAVLVQEIINADYAFVIHTTNPSSGDSSEIYTEVLIFFNLYVRLTMCPFYWSKSLFIFNLIIPLGCERTWRNFSRSISRTRFELYMQEKWFRYSQGKFCHLIPQMDVVKCVW